MQNIKVRGWDEAGKRFVYWTLNDLLCRFGKDEYKDERVDCSPLFVWERYIGHNDKNGTDIYDGDVLLQKGKQYASCIRTLKIFYSKKSNTPFVGDIEGRWSDFARTFDFSNAEIIGNSHENNNLLIGK